MITVVLVLALEIFVTFHPLTTFKRLRLKWPVAMLVLSPWTLVFAQETGYPLGNNQPKLDIGQYDESIRFSALPSLNQQSSDSNPLPLPAKESIEIPGSISVLSKQFESAYQDLGDYSKVRNLPKMPTPAESLAPPLKAHTEDDQLTLRSLPSPTIDVEFVQRVDNPQPADDRVASRISGDHTAAPESPVPPDQAETKTPETTDSPIWWKQNVLRPLLSQPSQQSVDTNSLVYDTLKRSPRIRALSQNPLVREVQVIEADADFDPTSFVRSQFQDRVDPVGSDLSITNDGSAFLQDNIWTGEFGLRRKLRTGASYELGQTLGFKNSNSAFFTPQDQATAQLALNVTQPLLRGRGRYYNESQILIAQAAGAAAWETFVGELQDEIQQTVESYWRLYYDRSVYLQKQRNVERGQETLNKLEGRSQLDSLPSQIARARSAVKSRKTDLANAMRDIRDSETELRRLTADRNWEVNQTVELLPAEAPTNVALDLQLEQVVFTALEHRPEIKETMKRAKIAGIQRDVSLNDLLPELSFLIGTYVSALQGESQMGQAIVDQFGEVTPGYSVGFEFEMPIRNRAARSRLVQRKLQLAKIKSEVDESVQNVIAESQIALRRVTSAQQTLAAALQAIEAARTDLEQNFRRWESFALIEGDLADGQSPTTILDQLLDSQERLASTELVYAQAELELKIAEVALQRSMGTLLIQQNVAFGKNYECDTPQLDIEKFESERAIEQGIPVGVGDPPFPTGSPSKHFKPQLSRNYAVEMPGSEYLPIVSTPSDRLVADQPAARHEAPQKSFSFPTPFPKNVPAKTIGYPLGVDN